MILQRIQVLNYKGFRDSGIVDLAPHLNVLVGQNNAGKSAFLQAFEVFQGRLDHTPHRNPDQAPGTGFPGRSEFKFRLQVSGDELLNFAYIRGMQLVLSLPDGTLQPTRETLEQFRTSTFDISATAYPNNDGWPLFEAQSGSFQSSNEGRARLVATPMPGESDFKISSDNQRQNLNVIVWEYVKAQIFTFKAERYQIGQCDAGLPRTLYPDARNLPICIQSLLRSRSQFEKFVRRVKLVLPQVHDLSAAPVAANNHEVEIVIYSARTDRPELGIPLNSCGTGVAQVIAILYVIFTNENAVIVIDEPNSFLHPGATKNLMHIVKGASETQFIVSSHSADVVSALAPDQILHAVWNQERSMSEIQTLDGRKLDAKRAMMSNLGISFSDLFGHDFVVWVEGETEAQCFDLIVDRTEGGRTPGLVFLPMPWASKVDAKPSTVREFFEIFSRASEGAMLWPTNVRFSFDSELRTESERAEIVKRSRQRASFLPRRMYESYLLHPSAIASLLSEFDPEGSHTKDEVAAWMEAHRADYAASGSAEGSGDDKADAAGLLGALISSLSNTRLTLDKVRHGKWLTEWLLDNDPRSLDELSAYVQGVAS